MTSVVAPGVMATVRRSDVTTDPVGRAATTVTAVDSVKTETVRPSVVTTGGTTTVEGVRRSVAMTVPVGRAVTTVTVVARPA